MINNQNLAVLSEKVAHLESAVSKSTEASGISYDNTDSGLTADDVQGAIDEIVGTYGIINATIETGTSAQTFAYPTGFTSSNCVIIGARVTTKYDSIVDPGYESGAYYGNIQYSASGIVFTPKVSENAKSIIFILKKF